MKIRDKQYKILYLLLSLHTLVLLSSCSDSVNSTTQEEVKPIATQFIQLHPSSQDQLDYYPGSIEGEINVDIKPQVSGYIQETYVKEGSFVKKGQPLFKIRADVYESQVQNSNAAYKAAIANMLNAKNEVDKIEPLVVNKVVAEVQLTTAKANYEAARAQVEQAKATVKSSVINKNFTLVTSPVSGYVGRITNKIGTLVSPSDTNPLTTLSQINKVFVYFSLPESAFLSLQKENKNENKRVNLELADGSVYELEGKIENASGNINATTGSITMKAIFDNPKLLLRSGGTGKVIIHRILPDIISIPKSTVKDIQDQFFVYQLADSNKIRMTPIQIFGSNDSLYFVRSGLNNGNRIALDRIDALYDGEIVQPLNYTK